MTLTSNILYPQHFSEYIELEHEAIFPPVLVIFMAE